ncbi:imelysin family protein [Pseudooceanicola algae]|uniref:Imelysin-like domain-containing protein n=1 Tax=Pseudooceanicola algae TaxID=1537215 RepID=A0A418SER1_9RHOB|nr:imelysin family protein [Pseudooceanicola algae]QPM90201.1 hypothetical protein PSAL_014360 [Pseudooceanicola algae]
MRHLFYAALGAGLTLLAPMARAGTETAIRDHVLPGAARFTEASTALSNAAAADCAAPGLHAPWNAAFDAWLGISHLRFGPLETDGRVNAIAFWPDTRGFTPRQLTGLIGDEDPSVQAPEEFAHVSVAARGLFALEAMLYDPTFAYETGSYSCALVQRLSADLARMAEGIEADWQDRQAPLMESAGEPWNNFYLSADEALQVFYTSLLSGLEFTADQRLGRPLGTFDRPRPLRAEARRSGRSLQNVELSLIALRDLARHLTDQPIPLTEAAFDTALTEAEDLDDPVFAGVDDPTGRLKIEILQQRIQSLRQTIEGEIGEALGLTEGFNSADGD